MHDLSDVDIDPEQLRDEINIVLVTSKRHGSKNRLHIPNDGEPVCNSSTHKSSYVEKPVEVYPLGYMQWCEKCVYHWNRLKRLGRL